MKNTFILRIPSWIWSTINDITILANIKVLALIDRKLSKAKKQDKIISLYIVPNCLFCDDNDSIISKLEKREIKYKEIDLSKENLALDFIINKPIKAAIFGMMHKKYGLHTLYVRFMNKMNGIQQELIEELDRLEQD